MATTAPSPYKAPHATHAAPPAGVSGAMQLLSAGPRVTPLPPLVLPDATHGTPGSSAFLQAANMLLRPPAPLPGTVPTPAAGAGSSSDPLAGAAAPPAAPPPHAAVQWDNAFAAAEDAKDAAAVAAAAIATGDSGDGDAGGREQRGASQPTPCMLDDLTKAPKEWMSLVIHGTKGKQIDAQKLCRLEEGAKLYNCTRDVQQAIVQSVPQVITESLWYMQMEVDNAELGGDKVLMSGHISRKATHYVRPLVLFPCLMRPPAWLRESYTQLDEHLSVPCKWGVRSRLENALQWVAERRKAMREQVLTIWCCNHVYGPGQDFAMNGAGSKGEVTDRPYIPAFVIATSAEMLMDICHTWAHSSIELREISTRSLTDAVHKGDETQIADWIVSAAPNVAHRHGQREDVTLERAIRRVVEVRDIKVIKLLLITGRLSHHFRSEQVGEILERLAVDRNDPDLLMMLASSTRKELSPKALQFLIHSWSVRLQNAKARASSKRRPGTAAAPRADGPSSTNYEDVEQWLIKYIRGGRNPLSVVAAILQAFQDEMDQFDDSKRFMSGPYQRFHSLSLCLLEEVVDKDLPLPALHKLLHPSEKPKNVHDTSPMQVAFNRNDLDFVSHELLYNFVKQSWAGRRFIGLTNNEDDHAISLRNPMFGYRVLRSLGFGGGPLKHVLKFGMSTWHCAAFCSLAYFNSPRGRWTMHALCELVFLGIYQWIVLFPASEKRKDLVLVFLIMVVGNFVDAVVFTKLKFGSVSSMHKYLADSWAVLNMTTNSILLVLTIVLASDYWIARDPSLAVDQIGWLHMALCTTGVLVWVRFLSLVQPVYPRLGPLLITVGKMMGEVVAFAVPYGFVLSGFATLLSGIYSGCVSNYQTWVVSMLTLFKSMLGGFNFGDFVADKNGDPLPEYLQIFGSLVLVVYLVTVAILLLNLLVAIIVARYQPESNESLAQFRRAQVVDAYRIQVRHNTVCAPLNLAHYLFFWLPDYERHPTTLNLARALALVNPDGELHPDIHFLLPSGKGEFPHLAFLLTTYPVLIAVVIVCFFVCTPFAVWTFAHGKWTEIRKRWFRSPRVQDGPVPDDSPQLVTYLRKPFEQIQTTLTHQQQQEFQTVMEYIVQIPVMGLLLLVGLLLYVVLLGGVLLLFWFSIVWWLWKLAFSVFMMFGYPWYRLCQSLAAKKKLPLEPGSGQSRGLSLFWSTPTVDPDGHPASIVDQTLPFVRAPAGEGGAATAMAAALRAHEDAAACEEDEMSAAPTPHRPVAAKEKWKLAKELVVEFVTLHDALDRLAVDRALNESDFRPMLKAWGLPVMTEADLVAGDPAAVAAAKAKAEAAARSGPSDASVQEAVKAEVQELHQVLRGISDAQAETARRLAEELGRMQDHMSRAQTAKDDAFFQADRVASGWDSQGQASQGGAQQQSSKQQNGTSEVAPAQQQQQH